MAAQELQIKVRSNIVFEWLANSPARINSLRGGTRSGKTWNALLYFVLLLEQQTGKTLTIARQTMPALKGSAMRDYFQILNELGIYKEKHHNKTANEYNHNGNLVEFIGLKEAKRVRGRKRDYLFLNEANETTLESWRQLVLRTRQKIVIDYNPSDAFSWIYDDVENRDDCWLLVTTYKDNPFLEESVKAEIERLKEADEDYWRIYGLGEIGSGSGRIFTHWRTVKDIDYPYDKGQGVFGLDFGYNHPAALIEVRLYDDVFYWREMLYETKLTNQDLIEKLNGIPELKPIYNERGQLLRAGAKIIADNAEPKSIEEISRAGFDVQPAYKRPGSVKESIKWIKSKPLRIHESGANLQREIKRYSWKTGRDGKVTDEVVDFDNHLIDGGRYGSWEFFTPEVTGVFV